MAGTIVKEASADRKRREAVDCLIDAAMSEKTLPAIETAFTAMRDWLRDHPDDYAMWDAGEPLAMMEDALRIIEAEKAATNQAA